MRQPHVGAIALSKQAVLRHYMLLIVLMRQVHTWLEGIKYPNPFALPSTEALYPKFITAADARGVPANARMPSLAAASLATGDAAEHKYEKFMNVFIVVATPALNSASDIILHTTPVCHTFYWWPRNNTAVI